MRRLERLSSARARAGVLALVLFPGVLAAVSETSRDQARRDDVAFLASEFPAKPFDFSKLYPRERLDRDIDAITGSIPTATDSDIILS